MERSPLGLYVHIPFCAAICNYCNFNRGLFDADLKRRNPAWGLRDLADVAALAQAAGFSAPVVTEMPANNLSVAFRRQ